MNATSRTLVFAGVAAVSALAAVSAWYGSRPAVVEGYADVGQEFFTEFTDPLKATSLTVTEYSEQSKSGKFFEVRQNDQGHWVIPSHHDYPAEAQERLARTAASLIGISKTAVQSRNKEDWKLYAVVDPSAEGAATKEERGTRVTLRDASGNALVDLIVGRKVDGREDHYYVREPEKNTTYISQMKPDLSAKFSDWIEPDLLKLNQTDIVDVTVDNYSVDEQQGVIVKGEVLDFAKEDLKTTGKWQLKGLDESTEKLDESPVRSIASNLDNLKIVGVRPKPEGLNADLTVSREVAQNPLLRQVLQADMQRQGFYVASGPNNDVRLVSNEGELRAGTADGVQYTLYFGEVVRGSEKDIEVGFADKSADGATGSSDDATKDGEPQDKSADTAKTADSESTDPTPEDTALRRYLLVKVDFDETLLGPAPEEPAAPVKPAILDEAPANSSATPEPGAEAAKPTDEKPAADPASDSSEPAKSEAPAESETPKKEDPASETPPADESPAPAEEKPAPESSDSEAPAATDSDANSGSDEGTCGPVDEAQTDEPQSEEPKSEEPKSEEPKSEEPKSEEPKSEEPKSEEPKAEEPKPEQPKTDAAPAQTAEPAAPPVDPRKQAQEEYDRALGEYEAKKSAYERDLKTRADKIAAGQKKAKELSERFSSWYYVISADSFEKFRVQRKDVVSLKGAEDNAAEPASGLPGNSFLPPGLQPGNP